MNGMELTGSAVIIGAVLPFLFEFINRFVKNSNLKFLISLLLPLLIGVGISFNQLGFGSIEAILASGSIVFASAQSVYKLWFKDSGLQQKIAR